VIIFPVTSEQKFSKELLRLAEAEGEDEEDSGTLKASKRARNDESVGAESDKVLTKRQRKEEEEYKPAEEAGLGDEDEDEDEEDDQDFVASEC
jgi:hypothetical protein